MAAYELVCAFRTDRGDDLWRMMCAEQSYFQPGCDRDLTVATGSALLSGLRPAGRPAPPLFEGARLITGAPGAPIEAPRS